MQNISYKDGMHLIGGSNTHFIRQGDNIRITQTQGVNINTRELFSIDLDIADITPNLEEDDNGT